MFSHKSAISLKKCTEKSRGHVHVSQMLSKTTFVEHNLANKNKCTLYCL